MFYFNKVNRYAKHNRRFKRVLVFAFVACCLLFLSGSRLVQLHERPDIHEVVPPPLSRENKSTSEALEIVAIPDGSTTAVLVMAASRHVALKNHLDQLLKVRPSPVLYPIVISQDGNTESVTQLASTYANSSAQIFFIHHKERTGLGSQVHKAAKNYFYIAQHYKWALDRVFMEMGFDTVIVTEDDLDVADDFFSYFTATRRLLFEDKSIWCISAWNDNGGEAVTDRKKSDLLYRTDFFPGLGWMLTSDVWKELSRNWPEAYWDDWLRRPEIRKGRSCIRPEVSRTAHNMKVAGKGSSNGLYKTFLSSVHLPDSPVDFSKVNVSVLRKPVYDPTLVDILDNAVLISLDLLSDTTDSSVIYKVVYGTPREFRRIAKKFKLMSDIRSGMARTAYYGVIPFMVNGARVYAVHSNFNGSALLNGTLASSVYSSDWDRMTRFLEFQELYCRPGKWTGKCDPANPDMIAWFRNKNRMKILNAWTGVIVN